MRLARACLVFAVCGACSFDHGLPGGTNNMIDAPTADTGDAFVYMDAPADARSCFGTFKNICFTTPPMTDLTVDIDRDVNTDTGCPFVFNQGTGQPSLCAVVGRNVTINARLRGNGPRPLVVIATEMLTISSTGMIDVGTYRETVGMLVEIIGAGAASGSSLCGSPTNGGPDTGMMFAGGGGGAGGSFGGKGGPGARGLNGNGGTGGTAANATGTPSYMRGGCRGTSGGSGNGNGVGSFAYGGGAVLVIAGTSIANAGHIRAGGMGGYGGGSDSGGGGGGSGGMIVLDAPMIMNSGILNANGGGGGEGGGQGGGNTAGSAFTGTTGAQGASGTQGGGNGGDGSWMTAVDGGSGSTDGGGGGAGGGGAGVLRIYPAQTLGGTVSPNPS